MPSQAVEQAYNTIRERIVSGAFPVGHRLVEDELAELTGVSRTPVRTALNRLKNEGLVEDAGRRGTRVTGWSADALDEIYELRALLEGHGAKLAARYAHPEALDAIERLCEQMERIHDLHGAAAIDRIAELNNELHATVFRAADSQRLITSLAGIVEVPLVHRAMARYSDRHLARSFGDHRELLTALRAGDAELAEAVMRAHILSARAELATTPSV